MSNMVIIYFFQVPNETQFRWNYQFWKRTQQNAAVCMTKNYNPTKHFDTVTPVAIQEEDLPKNVKPFDLDRVQQFAKQFAKQKKS